MISTAFLPDATSALQTVLAVSVLIAMVLIARRPVARHFGAGVAYALWAIPVARLLLPPLQIPVSIMPLLPWPWSGAEAAAAGPVMAIAPASGNTAPVVTLTPPAPPVPHSSPLTDVMRDGFATPESLADMVLAVLLPALFILWAGGTLVVFAISLWRQHVFMQTVKREAVAVSPSLQRKAKDVARQVGLKRLPVIASSFVSSGPLVTGLLRPVVLLPAWFETDYDDVQQRAALAHELTHVRRGDLWALQIAELFVACLWFNPLAHYARRAFRTDQEAACDADVLKTGTASPHAYGATLIKAVKSAAQERLPAAAGLPLTHALKERLSRMTHPAPTRTRRLLGGAAAAVLGMGALAATSSVTASAGEDRHRELRIDGGHVYLNGKLVRDRQIVILGDPFKDIEPTPEFDEEIALISKAMAEEGAKLGAMSAQITIDSGSFTLSPEDDRDFRALMKELKELPRAVDFNDDFTGDFDSELSRQDWETRGQKWESWAKQFGANADQWASDYEARADAVQAKLEPKLEKMSADLETRLEDQSKRLEALIDKKFGADFEARIEATTHAIDDMVEQCRDAAMTEGETRVLTRTIQTADGEREVKIACVKGNASALRSASTLAAIDGNKSLCPVEKQSFRDHVREPSDLAGAEN